MRVTIKESTIVRPAKDTPNNVLRLSNLDLLVPMVHIQTVYFYEPNGSSNFFDPRVLKEALGSLLVPFYPMAGRLGRDEDGRIEVHCNAEGVLFAVAEVDLTLDEFGDFTPRKEMLDLVPTGYSSMDISSCPLLLLQVTTLKCGAVCLGVGLHHTLADGASAIHLINSWSDVARGLSISVPPFIDRSPLSPRVPPSPTFPHTEYGPPPSLDALTRTQKPQSIPKTNPTTMVLTITREQMNTLKSKSRGNHNTALSPSTYEALAAHVWRCMCHARGLPDEQATRLYIATDGRPRLSPPLPPGYFGNVLFTTTVTSRCGQIRSNHLSKTIERIHLALEQIDDMYLRSAIDFLQLQTDVTALRRGAHTFNCPNLNIVSCIRLPIHDADFGWGRPVFMGPAVVFFEGMAYILPSPSGDGNLSVILCLDEPHMELFQKCFHDF